MNFLEICQESLEEVTLQGEIVSAEDAVGYQHLIVRGIMRKWKQIQENRPDWKFLRAEVDHTITAGTQPYTPTDILGATNVLRFGHWEKNGPIFTDASGNKSPVIFVSYDYWIRSDTDNKVDKPSTFTIKPQDNSLIFQNLNNDKDVKITYYKSPQILVRDADVPELPLENHDLLVWAGAMVAAKIFENATAYTHAKENYSLALGSLMRSQIPARRILPRSIA